MHSVNLRFMFIQIILSFLFFANFYFAKPAQADVIDDYLNSQLKTSAQLEWVPNGGLMVHVPIDCLPESFEKSAQQNHLPAFYFGQLTENYFNRCGKLLNRKASGGLTGLSEFALVSYPFLDNSKIKSHVFKLKNGRTLRGFIAIKDQTPRPWVIYKCGVFCSADANAASVKNYMIHLFDQSPFNMIILGNRTGDDYITENKVFNFGGYFDSEDFLEVAQWLKYESQYKKIVSSIHLVAVSLGGSAAYIAESKLSSSFEIPPLVQSITSICAVANLKPTVDDMFGNTAKGKIFSHITWKKLQSYKPVLSDASDLITGDKPNLEDFPNLLGKITGRYISSTEEETEKIKTFWERNQFANDMHYSQVPLFIWASEDDSVVDYNINTETLRQLNLQRQDFNRAIVKLSKGEHCAFATAYGYSITSSILRTFILNNSPEFNLIHHPKEISFQVTLPNLNANEKIVSYEWSSHPKLINSVLLNFYIYGADDSLCPEQNAYQDHENCYRKVSIELQSSFFSLNGFTQPLNIIENQALARELNARISLLFDNENIVNTSHWPNRLLVRF